MDSKAGLQVESPSAPLLEPAREGPLVEELSPFLAPEEAFQRVCHLPGCLFLDSALEHSSLGRYAFLAADPFEFYQVPADGTDALAGLGTRMARWRSAGVPDLPPFQGGAAGLFGYELCHSLERLPRPAFDEFHVPALAVGFYDVVAAFDLAERRAWVISHGFPQRDPLNRRRRAEKRLRWFAELIRAPVARGLTCRDRLLPGACGPSAVPASQLAPQFPVGRSGRVTSNFSRAGYLRAVERVIDYISAGDVFQVNLAQRLLCPATCPAPELYRRLRQRNPAPFAGYFDLGPFQIISASPERFLRVQAGRVETRPIKGTRPRRGCPDADAAAVAELRASAKDRAENVMIVDLLRNDLSRVCRPESVRVSQLCAIEAYQFVFHLVSAVEGQLRQGAGPVDLLRAAFPGGSITGAPKVRAMEIIAELEPTARGAYCGSLGYLGFDGSLDLSILIRTITAGGGWWQMPVGGGIVAQSSPQAEYEETWQKAEGLLRAIEP